MLERTASEGSRNCTNHCPCYLKEDSIRKKYIQKQAVELLELFHYHREYKQKNKYFLVEEPLKDTFWGVSSLNSRNTDLYFLKLHLQV